MTGACRCCGLVFFLRKVCQRWCTMLGVLCAKRRWALMRNGMQAVCRNTPKVSSCHKGLYCVSCCVCVQKEAGILERGMQALRSTIGSLLGQTGGTKPEDKVWPDLLCCNPLHMQCS